MKTLIVYASEYGYTKDCVESLARQIGGETLVINANNEKVLEISNFDNILVGGSIYMGQIQKNIKEFCTRNLPELLGKNLGLFISCGFPENFDMHLKNSFPSQLLETANYKECFGGELRMDRMKFIHKTITKMMQKAQEKEGKASIEQFPERITKLAQGFIH